MLKFILLLSTLSIINSALYANWDDYCNMSKNRLTCSPSTFDQINMKWFFCDYNHNKDCVSVVSNFPNVRTEIPESVAFSNGTHWYKAPSSFDEFSALPYAIDDIKTFTGFKNVAYINVNYRDINKDAGEQDTLVRYYPNEREVNIHKLGVGVITSIKIHPKAKAGCAIFFSNGDFTGDSWEICGPSTWFISSDRGLTFASYAIGKGVSMQFFSGPIPSLKSRRLEEKKLRFLDGEAFDCYRDDNGLCRTNRFSDHPFDYTYTFETPITPTFVSICSNSKHSRCFDYGASQN